MNGKTLEHTRTTTTTEIVEVDHAEMAYFDVDEYLGQGTKAGESERVAEENRQLLARIKELETKLNSTEGKLKTAEQRTVTAEHELDSSKSECKEKDAMIAHVTQGLKLLAERYNRVVSACQKLGVTKMTTMEELITILRSGKGDQAEVAIFQRELETVKRECHRLEKELEIERRKPPPQEPALLKENADLRVKCEKVMSKFKILAAFVASCKIDSESGSAELETQLKEANDKLEVVQKRLAEVRVATDLAVSGARSVSTRLAMNIRHKCRYATMDFDSTIEISEEEEEDEDEDEEA